MSAVSCLVVSPSPSFGSFLKKYWISAQTDPKITTSVKGGKCGLRFPATYSRIECPGRVKSSRSVNRIPLSTWKTPCCSSWIKKWRLMRCVSVFCPHWWQKRWCRSRCWRQFRHLFSWVFIGLVLPNLKFLRDLSCRESKNLDRITLQRIHFQTWFLFFLSLIKHSICISDDEKNRQSE